MKPERWPISWWTALTPVGQDVVLVVLLLGYGLTTLRETPASIAVTPGGPIAPLSSRPLDDPSMALLLVLTTVPLLCRRRWPTAAMVVVVAALVGVGHVGVRVLLGSILALLIATYAVGDLASRLGRASRSARRRAGSGSLPQILVD